MITKQSIQDFFHRDWRGAESLLNDILIPIFGEAERNGYADNILDEDSTLREQAARNNITAIHYCATFWLGGLEMKVFDVTIADNCHIAAARKGIQTIVRLHVEHFGGALMAFHYANPAGRSWRLSYMEKQQSNTASTNPKRYTYLCGSNYSCRTIAERFYALQGKEKNAQTLQDAFSVEALSDEFFDEYKVFYEDIVQYISGTRFVEITKNKYERKDGFLHDETVFAAFLQKANNDQAAAEKMVRDYVKKLLGRLVFLQFLQKKGWMGVPASQADWTGGDRRFMHRLFLRATAEQQADYINRILNPLFFRCLNQQRNHDVFDTSVHDYGDNGKVRIPYLNGGLFEQDPYSDIAVPLPAYFFSNGAQQDTARTFSKSADNAHYPYDHACGLFDFFDRYNFTIDENDPDDAEVGVDPEMLGKIFENLLEDNKDKGAYYTPKEIVRYMCEESLIAYLETECPAADKADLRSFITTFSVPDTWLVAGAHGQQQLNDTAQQVMTALRNVKICDPAIGSGAFPMGLLNILYHCGKAMDEYCGNTSQQHDANANIKRHIIQNNIYGVDIEKGAVDIARLRFWLALIVDEQTPEALPNLDYKIMQGNSLLTTFNGEYLNLSDSQTHAFAKTLRELKAILYRKQTEFYNKTGIDKYEAEIEIKQLLLDIIEVQLGYERESWSGKRLQTGDLFAPVQPIIKPQIPFGKQKIIDLCTTLREQLNNKTQPLSSRAATVIPFFDWQIMFSDVFNRSAKQGFDIVIGNPPYIKEYTNRYAFDGFREHSPYYIGKMDLWYGFACHGIDLLGSNGVLCFIAQNNWTTSTGAKKMRDKVICDSQILQMLDFNTYMVFESADIQTMVMLFRRNCNIDNYSFDYRIITKGNEKEDMLALLAKRQTNHTKYLSPVIIRAEYNNNLLTFSDDEHIFNKIKQDKTYLNDNEVAQGIVFPQDKLDKKGAAKLGGLYSIGTGIFGLSQVEKDALFLNQKEEELIRPYYTTEQIHRYYTDFSNTQWLIYTDSSFKDSSKMQNYPHIKAHLDKFLSIFTSDNRPYGLHRCRKSIFFTGEKILSLRKCVDRPCFSYSDFDCYVTQTFFSIKTTRWNMKFLTGLLNSTLVAFWLRHKGKMQGNNYQVDKEPLQNMPLPIVEISKQQPIIDLVDKILAAKKANPQTDTTELEEQIDKAVYKLYDLTPDEIAIVKGSHLK